MTTRLWQTLGLCLMAVCAGIGQDVPRIVAPTEILRDQVPKIRIEQLKPGNSYTVLAEYASRAGTIWRSNTEFRASDNGVVDLATGVPVSGSYSEADPLGIFWSMQNTRERSSDGLTFDNDDYSALNLVLREGEKAVAQQYVTLRNRAAGISTVDVRGPVTGTYLFTYGAERRPGVIVLGGSEGGVTKGQAALIASHGFPTLALGYFGMEGLPSDLERIPVETVTRGVEWLGKQPGVDPSRIIVVGMSKGAELAFLAAANNPKIKGVVAIAPSSVAFEGIGKSRTPVSSWTIGGKDVPFAPYVRSDEYSKSRRLVDLYNPTFDKAPAAAAIEVERIAGPILMLSGKDDALWPSSRMAGQIAARLQQERFRYPVFNRQWNDTGHHVARLPLGPTADSVRLGGSAGSIAHAQIEAWREMIMFLESIRK